MSISLIDSFPPKSTFDFLSLSLRVTGGIYGLPLETVGCHQIEQGTASSSFALAGHPMEGCPPAIRGDPCRFSTRTPKVESWYLFKKKNGPDSLL